MSIGIQYGCYCMKCIIVFDHFQKYVDRKVHHKKKCHLTYHKNLELGNDLFETDSYCFSIIFNVSRKQITKQSLNR